MLDRRLTKIGAHLLDGPRRLGRSHSRPQADPCRQTTGTPDSGFPNPSRTGTLMRAVACTSVVKCSKSSVQPKTGSPLPPSFHLFYGQQVVARSF